jgi:hypothetical protein
MKPHVAALLPLLFWVAAAHVQLANAYGSDKDSTPKEPALREELLEMEKSDVDMRNGVIKELAEKGIPFGGSRSITDPALVKAFMEPTRKLNEMDRKHRTRLKEIIKKHGWPGQVLVGKDGAHAAWLIVQHADRERAFQKRCLTLMKKAPKGDVELQDIAYLTDAILIAEKKKQLYGTQLQVKDNTFKPRALEDPANVDKRRKEMGMSTLAEYVEIAQAQYERSARKK